MWLQPSPWADTTKLCSGNEQHVGSLLTEGANRLMLKQRSNAAS
jgi:hypothetical protein